MKGRKESKLGEWLEEELRIKCINWKQVLDVGQLKIGKVNCQCSNIIENDDYAIYLQIYLEKRIKYCK